MCENFKSDVCLKIIQKLDKPLKDRLEKAQKYVDHLENQLFWVELHSGFITRSCKYCNKIFIQHEQKDLEEDIAQCWECDGYFCFNCMNLSVCKECL